jgi:hypothetical protein
MGRVQLMHRFALYVRCSYLHPSSSRFLPEFAGQEGSTRWMGGLRHIRQRTKHDVILTAPMERLGQAGQIVKVAPGYARNRLIPEMLALPAIEKFVLLVQNQLKVLITFSLFTFFGHQGASVKLGIYHLVSFSNSC